MKIRFSILAIIALMLSVTTARAQFSERYHIWASDTAIAESQIGQNCLGAYAAVREFSYLTRLFEHDGNDLTGFDLERDIFTIRAKAMRLEQDNTPELTTMLALQIGNDLTKDEDLFMQVGIAREVFAILRECQAYFEIPVTVRFKRPPPARMPTDRECGIRYATLLHHDAGAVSRKVFTQRSSHAANAIKAANPGLSPQEIFVIVDTAAQRAADGLWIGSVPNRSAVRDAYEDARACDAKYGFAPVPVPAGTGDLLGKPGGQ